MGKKASRATDDGASEAQPPQDMKRNKEGDGERNGKPKRKVGADKRKEGDEERNGKPDKRKVGEEERNGTKDKPVAEERKAKRQKPSKATESGHKCVDCMVPYHDGCSRGFAYVEFSSAEDADKAMHSLDKTKLMGQPVALEFAYEDICTRRKHYMFGNWGMRRSIIVKGIDESIEEKKVQDSLTKHFAECEVLNIKVLGHQDYASGKFKNEGKAILDFKDNSSFMKALELDKSKLDGQVLEVTEVKSLLRGPCYVCAHCGGVGITCAKCGGPIGGRPQVVANTNMPPQAAANTNMSQSVQKATVTTVVVKYFSQDYSQEETQNYLRAHFSSYGPVARVVVPFIPGSNVVTSTAFIYFEDEESANKALARRRVHLDGQKMRVESYRP